MLADQLDYVIGVDTHLEEHVLAVVAVPSGAVAGRRSIAADARGYAAAAFAATAADGARAWAIDGAGSYGAGLARYLSAPGETVLEISLTPHSERRLKGKDDAPARSGPRGGARGRDARAPS